MKKRWKFLTELMAFIILLGIAAIIYYFGAKYPYFDEVSTKECQIPGLNEGFTPQGLAYDDNDNILLCGYMKDSSKPSRIYVLSGEKHNERKYVTLTLDGEAFSGHTGGLEVCQDTVFLVSQGWVYRFDLNEVLSAEKGSSVAIIDGFKTENGANFITSSYLCST